MKNSLHAVLPKIIGFVIFISITFVLFWVGQISGIVLYVGSLYIADFSYSDGSFVSLGLAACLSYLSSPLINYLFPSLSRPHAKVNDRYFQLQTMLDSIPLPVFYKNLDHVYLGCNELFAKQFGFRKEEIIGKTSYDFSPTEIADQHHSADDIVIAKGIYEKCETTMQIASGEILEVIDHKSPIFDDNGEILGLIAVIQDITAQKKAEHDLLQSEQLYRDIANSSSEWAWETDKEGCITDEWAGFRAVDDMSYGLKPIGRTRKMIAATSDRPTDWTMYDDALELCEAFSNFEYYVRNEDGIEACLQISGVPFFGKDGKYLGHRGVGTDVTKIRKHENEVKIFDKRIRAAIEAVSEGFILFDDDDKLVLVNNKYKEMYPTQKDLLKPGAKFEDLIRSSILAGEVPAATGREEEWIKQRMIQHKTFDQVTEQHLANGRWVKVSEQNIAGGGNVGIRTDVTELKVAQIEAETSNRVKSEFLANMSHELRTPLNSMIGFSELMKSEAFGPIGTPKYKEYSADINNAGIHLLSLINDILNISKIEAGEETIEESVFPIEGVVSSCVQMVSVRVKEKGLVIKQSIQPDLPQIYADQRQMKQILLNLLSNAVKFTPASREIVITTTLNEEDGLDLIVADEGIGIAEVDIPKVVDPFYQVANAATRHHEGTGLGLALVKHLVGMHDGQLLIDSKLGHGTEITVRLPAERVRN